MSATATTAEMIVTDDYGTIAPRLFKTLKKFNVTPAEFSDIEDIYELIAETPIDHDQVVRWVTRHSHSGSYRAPWPLNPLDVLNA